LLPPLLAERKKRIVTARLDHQQYVRGVRLS
jgi:hypothetical protein